MTIDEAIAHAKEVAESWRLNQEDCDLNMDCNNCATGCEECAIEHEQLAEWLEELKERREYVPDTNVGNKSEWIPVEERLPEDMKWVLVTNWNHSILVAKYVEGRKGFVDATSGWALPFVYAWMPLPEPYKAKGE